MAAAAEARFRPTVRELVEFYLLPRARGQDPFPGVIIEDDAAGSSLPWDLFDRHGLESEDEAYFFVRAGDAKKPGARQDRGCDGGVGTWKMQSSLEKCLRVGGGEKIRCRRSNLNLHMGKGKTGGSVGWVMHEYTVAAPPCPSLVKICHIAFTGHGRKRKRVPDGQEDLQITNASQRAREDAAAVGCSSGAKLDCDPGTVVYDSADEQSSQLVLTEDDIFPQSPLLDSGDLLAFPSAASGNAEQYQELEQSANAEQYQDLEQSANAEKYQDLEQSANAEQYQELEQSANAEQYQELEQSTNAEQFQDLEQQVPNTEEQQVTLMVQQCSMVEEQQLSAGELEFWRSIGVDVQSSNFVEQEFWNSMGAESNNSMVPCIWDMAGDHHRDQQDFWSLSMADVQSDCTVPDMAATGALGGVQWGGHGITC